MRAATEAIEITALVIVSAVGLAMLGFVIWAALPIRRRINRVARR